MFQVGKKLVKIERARRFAIEKRVPNDKSIG
jgi:hypothetical protein